MIVGGVELVRQGGALNGSDRAAERTGGAEQRQLQTAAGAPPSVFSLPIHQSANRNQLPTHLVAQRLGLARGQRGAASAPLARRRRQPVLQGPQPDHCILLLFNKVGIDAGQVLQRAGRQQGEASKGPGALAVSAGRRLLGSTAAGVPRQPSEPHTLPSQTRSPHSG